MGSDVTQLVNPQLGRWITYNLDASGDPISTDTCASRQEKVPASELMSSCTDRCALSTEDKLLALDPTRTDICTLDATIYHQVQIPMT